MRNMKDSSLANLKKGKRFSDDYARNCAKKSADARGEAKRVAEYLRQELAQVHEDGETEREHLCRCLLNMAMAGNIRAFELVLKLIGEYPSAQASVIVSSTGAPDSEETLEMLRKLHELRHK